jgi:ATP-dependent protease Clp ATPase subunit
MSRILGDLPFVLNFIDSIVIFSKSREHVEHVKCLIERLNEAKLIINKIKGNFFSTQISLLVFITVLSRKKVDPTKLANIHELTPPTTAKQVQAYLGTTNFFREYIPLYIYNWQQRIWRSYHEGNSQFSTPSMPQSKIEQNHNYFIDGPGGTGKTILYSTLVEHKLGQQKLVVVVNCI